MPREFSTLSAAHKNQLKSEHPFVWLYEIEADSPATERLRFTNYTQQITASDPDTQEEVIFYPVSIVHDGVDQSSEGDLPSITVTVGNATLETGIRLEAEGGFTGHQARIYFISLNELPDLSQGERFECEVEAATVTPDVATFKLSSDNPFRKPFPARLFSRRSCGWHYGDEECGAQHQIAGMPAECPGYTLDACETIGAAELAAGITALHPANFGGEPGIPSGRRGT